MSEDHRISSFHAASGTNRFGGMLMVGIAILPTVALFCLTHTGFVTAAAAGGDSTKEHDEAADYFLLDRAGTTWEYTFEYRGTPVSGGQGREIPIQSSASVDITNGASDIV